MPLVDCTYVGPPGYSLADGTRLEPGVTIVQVGNDEAATSEYWQAVLTADLSKGKD